MIVSIHQPSYWPWLGLLDKIAKSDLFVLLDNVKIKKQSNQYRNLFLANDGVSKYLTLPVHKKSVKLNELEFAENDWKKKHLHILKSYYNKSFYFNEIHDTILKFYTATYETPIDVLRNSVETSMQLFDIKTPVIFASSLNACGFKGKLNFDICDKVNASAYICGQGAKDYMVDVVEKFENNGIKIIMHDFYHPIYEQNKYKCFVSGLSCLDLLYWQGIDKSKNIFWRNVKNV